MYEFSRAIYRDLSPLLLVDQRAPGRAPRLLRDAAESAVERLAADPRLFARPARSLFREVSGLFPAQHRIRVYETIEGHLERAIGYVRERAADTTVTSLLRCRATTRRGKECQRVPLPGSRYCPSHKHLESREPARVAA